LLNGFREEFSEAGGALARWKALHEHIVHSSEELIRILEAAPQGVPVMVPDSLLADMGRTPTYTPAINSLDAALGSGQIALIRSAAVQRGLANWTRLLADAQEEEERSAALVYSDLLPAVARATNLGPAMAGLTEDVRRVMEGRPAEPWPSTASEVVVTQELTNLVWVRFRIASSAANELGILQDGLTELLQVLEAETR
jgi:hypothetical protein